MFPSGKDAPPQRGAGEESAAAGVLLRTSLPRGGGGPGERLPGADRHFSDQLFGLFYQNIRAGGVNLTCGDWAVYSQTLVLLLLGTVACPGLSRPRKQRQN